MFELNEEQRSIQKSVHDFAKKELAPKASYWDIQEEFPWELVKKMAEMGLTGLRLPTDYGGMGGADLITTGSSAGGGCSIRPQLCHHLVRL